MAAVVDTITTSVRVLGVSGLLYTATITMTAAASIFARTPARRRDGRAALTLLLRGHSNPDEGHQEMINKE